MQVVRKHNTRAWMQGKKTFKSPCEDGLDKDTNHQILVLGILTLKEYPRMLMPT